jgi:hypothetical protein
MPCAVFISLTSLAILENSSSPLEFPRLIKAMNFETVAGVCRSRGKAFFSRHNCVHRASYTEVGQ